MIRILPHIRIQVMHQEISVRRRKHAVYILEHKENWLAGGYVADDWIDDPSVLRVPFSRVNNDRFTCWFKMVLMECDSFIDSAHMPTLTHTYTMTYHTCFWHIRQKMWGEDNVSADPCSPRFCPMRLQGWHGNPAVKIVANGAVARKSGSITSSYMRSKSWLCSRNMRHAKLMQCTQPRSWGKIFVR